MCLFISIYFNIFISIYLFRIIYYFRCLFGLATLGAAVITLADYIISSNGLRVDLGSLIFQFLNLDLLIAQQVRK